MPKEASDGSAHPRESWKHWVGVTADDIPPGWIDDMVKRLLEIMNRNMIRLENAQRAESAKKEADGEPAPPDWEQEVREGRLVTEMRRNLERLSELEMKRSAPRGTERGKKVAISRDEIRREIKRRVDQVIAGEAAGKDLPKPE